MEVATPMGLSGFTPRVMEFGGLRITTHGVSKAAPDVKGVLDATTAAAHLIFRRCGRLVERTPKRYNVSMNTATQGILNTALQLPDKERADLAASLIESLDRPFDPDVQAAWAEEIHRRIADLDSGAVKAIPWDEARQMIAGGT